MSRSDLKDLGETLDAGQAALVAVAATAVADRVEALIKHAQKVERKQLKADTKAMHKDAEEAAKASRAEAHVPSQRSETAATPQEAKG